MKIIYGIVSGYFNPLHAGHIEYIQAASLLCDKLIVIINNDEQVKLKESAPFMDERHRKIIVNNLKQTYKSIISIDSDKTVCETLKYIRRELYPNDTLVFYNSGDRKGNNLVKAESIVCREHDIVEVVIDLPKIYSSSDLIKGKK